MQSSGSSAPKAMAIPSNVAAGGTGAGMHRASEGGGSSPLGTTAVAGGRVAAVPAALRVLSYQPPPEELVEALTQLFRSVYILCVCVVIAVQMHACKWVGGCNISSHR